MTSVRSELRELGIPALKRLGQHFLLSEAVREELVEQAKLSPDDTVVEVGPGLGFVTELLASRAGRVLAIEKDRTLARHLTDKFSSTRKVEIIQGDALKFPIPMGAKIVSSPPYNISSKLILRIIGSNFGLASLLLQEDFVRRLTAASGGTEYGRLTVMSQIRTRVRYVTHVPKSVFYPQPKVDSAIAVVQPVSEPHPLKNETIFEELVRALFNQRRRKLRGVLSRYLAWKYGEERKTILSRVDFLDKRVYELTPAEFIILSNMIAESTKE